MTDTTVPLLLGVVLAAFAIFTTRSRSLRMLPAILHNGAWVIALLIIGSGLMNYEPVSAYAWFLIGSAIIAFNLGVGMSGSARQPSVTGSSPNVPLVTTRQYRVLLLGFSVGFFFYLRTIASQYGLATLVTDPTSIRSYSTISYLEAFPIYGKVLFYLGPLCLILTLFPHFVDGIVSRPWRILIAVYLAGAQIATLQRTNIFVCLVWVGGLLVLKLLESERKTSGGSRLNGRRLAALAAAVVVGLSVFQGLAVALGKTGDSNAEINAVVDPRLRGNPLTSVLHYASSGVPAFGKLVESQDRRSPPAASERPVYGEYNPQTWGRATFTGPLKLIPGINHWQEIAPFTRLPVPTNVYTWLEPWYRDFRAPGVLFGSLVVGLVIGSLARRRLNSPEMMLFAGLLIGLSGLATFTNRYMTVMSVVLYVTLWALGRARASRRRRMATSAKHLQLGAARG